MITQTSGASILDLGLEHPGYFVFKGEILGDLDRAADAVREYDKAIEQDPLYAPALFRKAEQLAVQNLLDEAKATLEFYFANATSDDEDRPDAESLRDALLRENGS